MEPLPPLVPRPHEVRRTGPDLVLPGRLGVGAYDAVRVMVGSDAGCDAWRLAAAGTGNDPAALPPEGYLLTVTGAGARAEVAIAGADPGGVARGEETLRALLGASADGQRTLPQLAVCDWPDLSWRGVVEGFYGPPWTHADRLAHLDFAARHKLNVFVHAPKDDAFHRTRWREPYSAERLGELRELATAADARHLRLVVALAPGLSMRYADPAEHTTLATKAGQLLGVGVHSFALFFDDIPVELEHPADIELFGPGPAGAAAAHADACNRFAATVLGPSRGVGPLLMAPTDYAGVAASPYRDRLARDLDPDVLICWTGRDVVVGEVTRSDVDAAAASFGRHRLLLWDNFPVNDFAPERVFLGPLTGRTTDLSGSALAGIVANPMPQAAASELALATVADYAWNLQGYDPVDAASRALGVVAGTAAPSLAPLVAACSGWPPDSPPPQLDALMRAALADATGGATEQLLQLFGELATGAQPLPAPASRLVVELTPWLRAAARTGHAGELATRLLLATAGELNTARRAALRAEAMAALDLVLAPGPYVLRAPVASYARAVLGRAADG